MVGTPSPWHVTAPEFVRLPRQHSAFFWFIEEYRGMQTGS
ncbi:hypothetical protein L497_3251 [Bordetella holmesii CDC-H585-BH]|uniref:Uncharacterized protein n=1 Tax=Bordetella holmesii CDC-H585-BH TaxID=1331206 RepID=A0A158M414_9BORD|nr:hypothetical protein L503_3258 [Bordetella holmesii CDC-H809-BH]KAK90081.1 hypothetical protein L497_3251 [Bordetella holmesii CDC-H585-BH]